MAEPTVAQDPFKGRHFDREIIILCVRWYLTFKCKRMTIHTVDRCPEGIVTCDPPRPGA